MVRKVVFAVCLLTAVNLGVYAQDRMPNRVNTYSDEGAGTGFLKQNLFVGGSLGLGFGNYEFNVGVNPEIGYSLNRWLDVGAVVNFNYNSMRPDDQYIYNPNERIHQFTYGGGLFARAWFLPFLFVTAQPEYNWTSETDTYLDQNQTIKYNGNAPSLLLGAGYGRRIVGESSFYIAIMFDAISNKNSPYNDFNGHPLPVIRAGFDVFVHHSH